MSHFSRVATKMVDSDLLVLALTDLGFSREYIEVHEQAQPLAFFAVADAGQTAEVIIRRRHIPPGLWGDATNDLGFKRHPDGCFTAIIDEESFDSDWTRRLFQRYAYQATIKHLTEQGFSLLQTTDEQGALVMTLVR